MSHYFIFRRKWIPNIAFNTKIHYEQSVAKIDVKTSAIVRWLRKVVEATVWLL